MPHFPQELVDELIACLADNTNTFALQMPPTLMKSLTSCSLVSKSFSVPARKLLFSSVIFCPYPSIRGTVSRHQYSLERTTERINTLGLLLKNNNSDLRSLITSLSIMVDIAQSIFHDTSGIYTAIQTLISSPGCNLKNFYLSGDNFCVLSWNRLKVEVKEILTAVCHCPSIKSVSLSHLFDVPSDIVLGNVSMDSLWLVQTKFSPHPHSIEVTSNMEGRALAPNYPPFKRLSVAIYLKDFWDTFSDIDRMFSHVEDFGTSIYDDGEVQIFKTVLGKMPRTLQNLSIALWGNTFERHIKSIDMDKFIRLKSMIVCLILGNTTIPTVIGSIAPIRWLTFLNDINIPKQMAHITVVIQLCLRREEIISFQNLIDIDEKIKLLIFDREKFPKMTNIDFYVNITIKNAPGEQPAEIDDSKIRERSTEKEFLLLMNVPEASQIVASIICTVI